MNYAELLEKYNSLLKEIQKLQTENNQLKDQLSKTKQPEECNLNVSDSEIGQLSFLIPLETVEEKLQSVAISKYSDPMQKVHLFRSLFKGREDVFAKRWQNQKGHSGYSPVCRNEWQSGLCSKPQGKCSECEHKSYVALTDTLVDEHLRGKMIAGIYPLLPDETCWFVAADFDDEEWQKDISAVREVCKDFDLPVVVERSRSGNGAHVWIFFRQAIDAFLARKLGSAIITFTMSKRHEMNFKSYDRLFPNQDTMPKGNLGNLIALPLQKAAREENNSVFIDENFQPYEDQWGFLASVRKLSEEEVETTIARLCRGHELGELQKDDEDTPKPWETVKVQLSRGDYPQVINVVRSALLYIPKSGFSERALNQIKRLAAFKNPEFFKAQAMRLPTFNKPRVISCSEETAEYIGLPRGCEGALEKLLKDAGVWINWVDKTNEGRIINIEFNGCLREEQQIAAREMLKHTNGVLSGTTAFGKTVVAINLIAERKTNTLILVDRVSLVSQWKERLEQFLLIHEVMPEEEGKTRRRKKQPSIIGQLGGGKDSLTGIIDIAVMQSLYRQGEVKECVKNYGMVIVDECHHVSAVSFEHVLKQASAQYVYGLTATPTRKDGHHPIIFMQCGPIRYRDDAIKQAAKRPFEHYIVPRFTSFRVPLDQAEKEITIQELYSEIVSSEIRNQQIIGDVIKCYNAGRNCLVLTERTAHVERIAQVLSKSIPDVLTLTGGMGAKAAKVMRERIADIPVDHPLILVATGKYIGEGFDEPRLDTLFLAMPISWKGTLQQYAGRLHRLWESKSEVQIYDYVDVNVRMLEKMYHKRLSGYASIGYKAKSEENISSDVIDIIFDKKSFLPVYSNDLISAEREIIIVSSFITKKRVLQMIDYMRAAVEKKLKVVVVTRPKEDFQGKNPKGLVEALELLNEEKVSLVYRSNLHQNFAVMDQKLVWYGSINLLSFGNSEESMMRLESPTVAHELLKSL